MPWWWWGCIPTLEVIVDLILPFGWSQILCTVWIAYQGNCIVFNRLQSKGLIFAYIIATWHVLFFSTWSWKLCHPSWRFFFSSPNLVWLSPQCRYCQRAKALFKELNEQPYIVEIDLRGNIRIKSLSLSFSLSYLAFELWTQFFGYGVSHCCSLYDGDSAKSSLHK